MKEIIRFQKDRGLDKQEYDYLNESTSIVEELLEIVGLNVPKENRQRLRKAWSHFIADVEGCGIAELNKEFDDEHDPIDGFNDIKVFCDGAQLKKGYNPIVALRECGKEINSRVGSMVNGKFEKDLSDEAKANWYKADYSLAKLKE